ncbi:replication initiator protein A [Stieleria sp. ICT_E10.1]|uniref:replication initiator protein A n=1 Tax=Stieleria sedimenti TaxID=2976331 RepID=UPI00217FF914|nr:replication initiator protein A [Stieleria sedimenti]MCS7466299.1 replication initiator protein A [Stieleria sedimenti]
MNLVEFPICRLSSTNEQSIEIVHEVRDRTTKKLVQRTLIISGSAKFGLPRPIDEQVLLGLSSLTHQNGAVGRKVAFSQYQLLQTIGWSTDGRAYRRLAESFDRLTSVFLKFSNAWWDKGEREYRSHGFHLIESYELCSGERYSKHRNQSRKRSQMLSSFVWSDVMWKSIGDGYIRSIDMEMFRKIAKGRRREVPIRLYRWLGKQFWPRTRRTVQFDLMRLAEGTLGLAERYPSQVVRIVERAANVLIDVGFLSDFNVVKRRGGSGWDGVFVRMSSKRARATPAIARKAHVSPAETTKNAIAAETDDWIQQRDEAVLARVEREALKSKFGTDFERRQITTAIQKGRPISASGQLRKNYVRRYADAEYREQYARLLG